MVQRPLIHLNSFSGNLFSAFLANRAENNLFCFSHSSEQEEKIIFLIFSSLGFEPATPN